VVSIDGLLALLANKQTNKLAFLLFHVLFSPLGKPADWAIYFTFRNFFLFLIGAKLSQDLLDRFSGFFFTKWKVFA